MTTTIQRNHLIHAVCTVVPSEHWGQAERLVDGLPHSTSDNVEGNILAALRVAGLSNYSAQGAQVARVAIEQATGTPQPTAAPASEAPDTSEVVTFDDLVAAISAVVPGHLQGQARSLVWSVAPSSVHHLRHDLREAMTTAGYGTYYSPYGERVASHVLAEKAPASNPVSEPVSETTEPEADVEAVASNVLARLIDKIGDFFDSLRGRA